MVCKMLCMKNIIVFLLCLMPIMGISQNGMISIFDKETRQAIPFVNISFESIKTGEQKFAISNTKGRAENPFQGACIISISHIGYLNLVDTIDGSSNPIFYLQADFFDLNQVVITATRSEKSLKDAPVITQVITAKSISARGISNVQDVLSQDVPGLEFQRGGFGADIKMQGLEAKNILILIDGERMAGESGNNIDYSRLNVDNIERIEIVKGAASALYGSKAMGGVINIITKDAQKKFEVSAGVKYTQSNEKNYPDLEEEDSKYLAKRNLDLPNINANISLGFKHKVISGRTDFSAKTFDAYQLYDSKTITKEFINIDTIVEDALNPFPTGINGFRDFSVQQKLDFKLSNKLKLGLKASYYNHDEYDFVPDNVYQNFEDFSYGIKLNYSISKRYNLLASYHYDNYRKFDYYEKLGSKEINYRNVFVNPRLIFSADLGKYQYLTVGAEYLSDALLSDKFVKDISTEKSSSTAIAFIQDDITLNPKWNFIIGGRMDYHDAFGGHFSPKASLMYKHKSWVFRANYANGFRSPSLKELYMEWPIAWFTIRGDENLLPETNNYFSASAEFTKGIINTSATLYHNRLQNKIDGVWQQGQTIYQYINVSKSELSGLELMMKVRILRPLVFSGSYSYLRDKRPQGELVSSASPHSGNAKLSYKFFRKRYDFQVNLSANILGAKDYQVSEQIQYGGQMVEGIYPVHFDAYSIWNLSISQNLSNGINVIIGIDNLFDFRADIVSFNTSTSPGRRLFVSLNYSL